MHLCIFQFSKNVTFVSCFETFVQANYRNKKVSTIQKILHIDTFRLLVTWVFMVNHIFFMPGLFSCGFDETFKVKQFLMEILMLYFFLPLLCQMWISFLLALVYLYIFYFHYDIYFIKIIKCKAKNTILLENPVKTKL